MKKPHPLVQNENQTLVLPASKIVEPAALIPDHGNNNKRAYLRLTRRKRWPQLFEKWLEEDTGLWDDSDEEYEAGPGDESDIELGIAMDKPSDISPAELADILRTSEECRRDTRRENESGSVTTRARNRAMNGQ